MGVMGVVAVAMWRLLAHGHLGTPAALAVGALVAVTALTKVNVGGISDRRGDARPREQPARFPLAQGPPQSGDVVGIGGGAGSCCVPTCSALTLPSGSS